MFRIAEFEVRPNRRASAGTTPPFCRPVSTRSPGRPARPRHRRRHAVVAASSTANPSGCRRASCGRADGGRRRDHAAPVRLVGPVLVAGLCSGGDRKLLTRAPARVAPALLKGQSPWSLGPRVGVRTGLRGAVTHRGPRRGPRPWQRLCGSSALDPSPKGPLSVLAIISPVIGAAVAVRRGRGSSRRDGRTRSSTSSGPPAIDGTALSREIVPVAAAIVTYARLGPNRRHSAGRRQRCSLRLLGVVLSAVGDHRTPGCPGTGRRSRRSSRWRLAGKRLPPALLTGLRRSLAEPGVTGL